MGFDQSPITNVFRPVTYGNSVLIRWASNAPVGSVCQVYVNAHLSHYGTLLQAMVPAVQGTMYIDVGVVPAANTTTDYSSSLVWPQNRVILNWIGGTYQDPNIAGFHIYQSPNPNDPINYAKFVKDQTAYIGKIITDGYGLGGYGLGTWGYANAYYSWVSGTLRTGVWSFAIVPYNQAGIEGTGSVIQTTITDAPIVMPPFTDFTRLKYTLTSYDGGFGFGQYGGDGYGGGGFPGPYTILNWNAVTG